MATLKPRSTGYLTGEEVNRAAKSLAPGVPLSRVNIAEQAAVGSDAPVKLRPTGRRLGQRIAPAGSIEERVLRDAGEKLRAGTANMTPAQKRQAGVK